MSSGEEKLPYKVGKPKQMHNDVFVHVINSFLLWPKLLGGLLRV